MEFEGIYLLCCLSRLVCIYLNEIGRWSWILWW